MAHSISRRRALSGAAALGLLGLAPRVYSQSASLAERLAAYAHGLRYEEIALRLGVSTNMVKKYLSQALVHCRRRMARLR